MGRQPNDEPPDAEHGTRDVASARGRCHSDEAETCRVDRSRAEGCRDGTQPRAERQGQHRIGRGGGQDKSLRDLKRHGQPREDEQLQKQKVDRGALSNPHLLPHRRHVVHRCTPPRFPGTVSRRQSTPFGHSLLGSCARSRRAATAAMTSTVRTIATTTPRVVKTPATGPPATLDATANAIAAAALHAPVHNPQDWGLRTARMMPPSTTINVRTTAATGARTVAIPSWWIRNIKTTAPAPPTDSAIDTGRRHDERRRSTYLACFGLSTARKEPLL